MVAKFGLPFEPFPSRPARLSEEQIVAVRRVRASKKAQSKPVMTPPAQRGSFDLIEATLTAEAARAEALRCVQCTTFCDKCVEVCPNRANFAYSVSPVSLAVPQLSCQNSELVATGKEILNVEQDRQIIHLDDFCNECGNCATFCVHRGKPYAEKPRLFFKEHDFRLEDDNAFYIESNAEPGESGAVDAAVIRRRERGQESKLTMQNGSLSFENQQVRIQLTHDFQIEEMELKEAFEGTLSLREVAEMSLIYRGLAASAPFLLV
jgi:putative selenate reductase